MKRPTMILALTLSFLFLCSFGKWTIINQFVDAGIVVPAADTIPVWTKNLYEVRGTEFRNRAVPIVIYFKKLSDTTSYCVYEVNDGLCEMTFVATQRNRKDFKRMMVGNICDANFSLPTYTYTIYKHDSLNRVIRSIDHVQKAKDKYLVKDDKGERFKQGYNLDNVETLKSSTTTTISINKDGSLIVKK
jgi:hypothetical protein